jgi:hypothetical protein
MSHSIPKHYKEIMAKTRKRFIGFGRKKAIQEARGELTLLYKRLIDELDPDYAAFVAKGAIFHFCVRQIFNKDAMIQLRCYWHNNSIGFHH